MVCGRRMRGVYDVPRLSVPGVADFCHIPGEPAVPWCSGSNGFGVLEDVFLHPEVLFSKSAVPLGAHRERLGLEGGVRECLCKIFEGILRRIS